MCMCLCIAVGRVRQNCSEYDQMDKLVYVVKQ